MATSGWNRPAAGQPVTKKGGAKKPTVWKGLAAGLVVVAIGVMCAWMFSGGDEHLVAEVEKRPAAIKEVVPAPAPKAMDETPPVKEEPEIDPKKRAWIKKVRSMSPEDRVEAIFDAMKNRPLELEPTTNRPFRTGVELQMARIFTKQLGDMPPPLMPIPLQDEAHLAEILIANNPVLDGDSETVVKAKAAVEDAKKELMRYIKDGGDITSFLQYYHAKLVDAHQERMTAHRSVMQVIHEDPDIATDYVIEVNKKLTDKGIKPVSLPERTRQRLGLE